MQASHGMHFWRGRAATSTEDGTAANPAPGRLHQCFKTDTPITPLPPPPPHPSNEHPQGVTAFLPKKAAAAAGRPLAPGALLDVVVPPGGAPKPGGGAAGSVLTVDCAPAAVASAVAREWDGLNIGALCWRVLVGWCRLRVYVTGRPKGGRCSTSLTTAAAGMPCGRQLQHTPLPGQR
jgi:hypothetical protein